ncbi:MAG: transposase, partial [Verrucomicrobiota bacterium]|nr:transposase [Verrucomicrobiota bacterium]
DATNNLAERQLRPAVIRRKLSCGNKTRRGARTFEVLTSLAATCRQRKEDFLQMALASAPFQPA